MLLKDLLFRTDRVGHLLRAIRWVRWLLKVQQYRWVRFYRWLL